VNLIQSQDESVSYIYHRLITILKITPLGGDLYVNIRPLYYNELDQHWDISEEVFVPVTNQLL